MQLASIIIWLVIKLIKQYANTIPHNTCIDEPVANIMVSIVVILICGHLHVWAFVWPIL